MTYTTTATRNELDNFNIPDTLIGTTFRVTITPIKAEEEAKEAFRNLRGIIDEDLDLDRIRKERLSAYID